MIICGWFIYFNIRGPKNSREKVQEEFKSQWIEITVKCRLLDTTWLLHTSVHSSQSYPRKIKPVKIPAWMGGRPRSATLLQEHSAVDSCFRRERESPLEIWPWVGCSCSCGCLYTYVHKGSTN